MNDQNLIPGGHRLTHEEQSKGGKISGQNRQARKTMAEVMKKVLDSQITDAEAKQKLEAIGVPGTYLSQISLAQVTKATTGDVESARFVRDTIGERPASGVEITNIDGPVSEMDLSKLSDEDLMRAIERRKQR